MKQENKDSLEPSLSGKRKRITKEKCQDEEQVFINNFILQSLL